jgi:UDP-N-acetylglucosamine 2-epimerase
MNTQKSTYTLLHIIGARPHFMKLAPVYEELKNYNLFDQFIIHTGQHYDPEMSGQFLAEFNLPDPGINLGVGSNPPLSQMADILRGLEKAFMDTDPDLVIVYGDTNSTAAGAIAAAKMNIPVAHIEAGLREWNKQIPEEVNKLLTDAVTDLFFCPSEEGVKNLSEAGVIEHVYNIGDVVLSYITKHQDKINEQESILTELGLAVGGYFLATFHRVSNTESHDKVKEILEAFCNLTHPVVFMLHPRTQRAIHTFGLDYLLDHPNIIVKKPQPFWRTQCLLKHANMVLTDSGGIIKEAYFHKTPSIILDKQTEWVEILANGWTQIAGPSKIKILQMIETYQKPKGHQKLYYRSGAMSMLAQVIQTYLENNEG